MSVVAVTSSRTSPGATSLAAGLAIAWSHMAERSLLVEADPAGGVLALRFELAPTPSLTTFGSDIRNAYQTDLVWANTQDLRGAHCMPAPVDPRLARAWVDRLAPTLVTELRSLGAPTVVDLGWVDEDGASMPLVHAADTTLIVTRPDVAEVQGLLFQIRRLQDAGADVALVTVGDSPNNPQEISALTGVPLAAVLPDDPRVAAALAGGKFKPAKFRRSLLWRTISGLAETLFDAQLTAERSHQGITYAAPAADSAASPIANPAAGSASPPYPAPPYPAPPYPAPPYPSPSYPAPPNPAPSYPAPSYQPDGVLVSAPAMSDTGWAPGVLDELTPQALDSADPLPAVSVSTGDTGQRWTTGNLHELTPAASHELAHDLTPNNVAQPVVVATYIGTSSPAPNPPSIDPDLFEDTKRMHPAPSAAALVLPDGSRQVLTDGAAITIGRNRECTIVLEDSQVSRRHGRLTRTSQGWHFADLGSRNGSDLNGRPCTDSFLHPGDVLMIGRTPLTFETTSGSETSTHEMECA